MTQVFTKTNEALFEEVVEKGRREMIHDKEAYDTLIEEVIQDHVDMGGLDIDQDTEGRETHLKDRYDEYKERLLVE